MDDKKKKKRTDRIHNVRELITNENTFLKNLRYWLKEVFKNRNMMDIYMNPMEKEMKREYTFLSLGIDMIQKATEEIIRSFGFKTIDGLVEESELTFQNVENLNVANIIRDSYNKYIHLYVFLSGLILVINSSCKMQRKVLPILTSLTQMTRFTSGSNRAAGQRRNIETL